MIENISQGLGSQIPDGLPSACGVGSQTNAARYHAGLAAHGNGNFTSPNSCSGAATHQRCLILAQYIIVFPVDTQAKRPNLAQATGKRTRSGEPVINFGFDVLFKLGGMMPMRMRSEERRVGAAW